MPQFHRTATTRVLCFFIVVPPTAGNSGRHIKQDDNMSNEYKQCPNGHYYQGDHCPYCKSGSGASTKMNDAQAMEGIGSQQPTEAYTGGANTRIGENATLVDDGTRGTNTATRKDAVNGQRSMSGRTVFGFEEELTDDHATNVGEKGPQEIRETRKLVGWLVSYTLDPIGIDFKIYEGRNIIGRDPDCNITIADNWVSAKHAVLLFRAGKYTITDSQSSHGTFVNDTDIELEPYYLQDGDVIKMGQTLFKFRSAF